MSVTAAHAHATRQVHARQAPIGSGIGASTDRLNMGCTFGILASRPSYRNIPRRKPVMAGNTACCSSDRNVTHLFAPVPVRVPCIPVLGTLCMSATCSVTFHIIYCVQAYASTHSMPLAPYGPGNWLCRLSGSCFAPACTASLRAAR